MSKVCPNCDKIIDKESNFCPVCGVSFVGEYYPEEPHKVNAIEVISLVFGVLSLVTLGFLVFPEVVAIVCGVLSKDDYGYRTKYGHAGLVCGVIGACIPIGIIGLLVLINVLSFAQI